jgi:iron-sulfur cluster assembly accessory protein
MTAVRLSPTAAKRIALIAARQGDPDLKLRLSVDGGGCAGFQYKFGLEKAANPDDHVAETDGVQLVVDPVSLPFVEGAEVDYVESLGGASFQVRNPNATSGCGCGTSFAV